MLELMKLLNRRHIPPRFKDLHQSLTPNTTKFANPHAASALRRDKQDQLMPRRREFSTSLVRFQLLKLLKRLTPEGQANPVRLSKRSKPFARLITRTVEPD